MSHFLDFFYHLSVPSQCCQHLCNSSVWAYWAYHFTNFLPGNSHFGTSTSKFSLLLMEKIIRSLSRFNAFSSTFIVSHITALNKEQG